MSFRSFIAARLQRVLLRCDVSFGLANKYRSLILVVARCRVADAAAVVSGD